MAFGSKGRTGNRRPSQGNALFKLKKFCRFTAAHVEQIDYKDIDTLRDFIQENGKIMPARLPAPARYRDQACPLPRPPSLHRQSVIPGRYRHASYSA